MREFDDVETAEVRRAASAARKAGDEMVPCPRDCGWYNSRPEMDEDGMPYTCFYCCNRGQVPRRVAEAGDPVR